MTSGKLSLSALTDTFRKFEEFQALDQKLFERIEYICKFLFETFKVPFYQLSEFDGLTLDHIDHHPSVGEIFDVCVFSTPERIYSRSPKGNICIVDKKGKDFIFRHKLPSRWLFEDFEQEVIKGKKLWEAKVAKEQRQAAKKLSHNELIASAKKKLSLSELTALKSHFSQ